MGDEVTLIRVGGEELAVLSVPELTTQLRELSPAEREVLTLVLQGKSNVAIAETRGTAMRTVANQVTSIFRKLHVVSRGELVARLAGVD